MCISIKFIRTRCHSSLIQFSKAALIFALALLASQVSAQTFQKVCESDHQRILIQYKFMCEDDEASKLTQDIEKKYYTLKSAAYVKSLLNETSSTRNVALAKLSGCNIRVDMRVEPCTLGVLREENDKFDQIIGSYKISYDSSKNAEEMLVAAKRNNAVIAIRLIDSVEACVKSNIQKLDDNISGADVIAQAVATVCRPLAADAFNAEIEATMGLEMAAFEFIRNPLTPDMVEKKYGASYVLPLVLQSRAGNRKSNKKSKGTVSS